METSSTNIDIKSYDGVLSLGAWCQVGAAIRFRELSYVNSPIHNFGIKTWQNLMDILETRFEFYWEKENMAIGDVEEGYSAKYDDKRPVYKVYCNRYNMLSNHHFDVCDNEPGSLLTYDGFKERMDLLSEIFLVQCATYESVLFALKIFSVNGTTTISKEDLIRLCKVLNQLREGKSYDLRISVPKDFYDQTLQYITETPELSHILLYSWTIEWNDDTKNEEWQWMLDDVRLNPNHLQHLNTEIIGLEEISWEDMKYLNS